MNRSRRLAALRRLIENERIGSQESLLRSLKTQGFKVTQATLSRDLKYLKVGKIPDNLGGYLYTFSETTHKGGSPKNLVEDFSRGFVSIAYSGCFGLIKTLPGHANTVAFALDNLEVPLILGTVAGDDTILVVPRDGVSRRRLHAALAEWIPAIAEIGEREE